MKRVNVKKILVVIMSSAMLFCCTFAVGAETIQDRLERYRNSSGNSGSQQGIDTSAIGDFFQGLLNGETPDIGSGEISEDVQKLWDMVSGTDIGNVISELDLQALFDMGGEAWASARDMITDAIGGGHGTSDSSNTGTKSEVTTRQVATTYVITYDPVAPVTNAPVTSVPETTTAPSTTLPSVTPNNVSPIVNVIDNGEDDTAGEEEEEGKLSTASIVVIIILSVATIGVIAAVVIFFAVKKKY